MRTYSLPEKLNDFFFNDRSNREYGTYPTQHILAKYYTGSNRLKRLDSCPEDIRQTGKRLEAIITNATEDKKHPFRPILDSLMSKGYQKPDVKSCIAYVHYTAGYNITETRDYLNKVFDQKMTRNTFDKIMKAYSLVPRNASQAKSFHAAYARDIPESYLDNSELKILLVWLQDTWEGKKNKKKKRRGYGQELHDATTKLRKNFQVENIKEDIMRFFVSQGWTERKDLYWRYPFLCKIKGHIKA